MIQPATADDVKLLLWRVETMLMPAEQRERLTAWLEAKRDALATLETVDREIERICADRVLADD